MPGACVPPVFEVCVVVGLRTVVLADEALLLVLVVPVDLEGVAVVVELPVPDAEAEGADGKDWTDDVVVYGWSPATV